MNLHSKLHAIGRPLRVVVTGGRDFENASMLDHALDILESRYGIEELSHGGARGADALAGAWAKRKGIKNRVYPADWTRYGRAAGPIRNSLMIAEADPDLVVAFPGGAGTNHCVDEANRRGILVWQSSWWTGP